MAPSESRTEAIPDGPPDAPPVLEGSSHSIAPDGYGNGHVEGTFDQRALLHVGDAPGRLFGSLAR